MPRLANKGFTARAPEGAGSWPELPDLDPEISELDGGKTNAALQRWNDQVRARYGANEQQDNGRFRNIQTTISLANGYLESVWTMQAIAGPVVTGMTLFSSVSPAQNTTVSRITFQADVFQIQTASGNHKEVFSTSADAIKLGDVLTVDLANAKVYIGTGTYANNNTAFYVDDDGFFSLKSKLTFDPNTNTLTVTGTIVATAGSIGGWTINATTLTGGNATLNSAGILVLGTSNDVVYVSAADATYRLWVGNATAASATFSVTKAGAIFASAGTVGGWTLSSTTLSASNVVISSAGTIALGTSNDILIASAADATYRIWIGNATAGSAAFSVTKAGALFATGATISGTITSSSGAIGGFTIGATMLSAGSGTGHIELDSGAGQIQLGTTGAANTLYNFLGFSIFDGGGVQAAVQSGRVFTLYSAGGVALIQMDGASGQISSTGTIIGNLFSGSGASLTTLNASNISSGTLANARLPAAISVTSLTASAEVRGATFRGGTFTAIGAEVLAGWIDWTDAGGTARKVAVIA